MRVNLQAGLLAIVPVISHDIHDTIKYDVLRCQYQYTSSKPMEYVLEVGDVAVQHYIPVQQRPDKTNKSVLMAPAQLLPGAHPPGNLRALNFKALNGPTFCLAACISPPS